MIRFVLAFLALGIAFQTQSFGQSEPPSKIIFNSVIQTEGGFLNRAIYEKFWASIPPEVQKDKIKFSAVLRPILVSSLEYQKAVWESAELSFKARRVVRSPSVDAAEQNLKRVVPPQVASQMPDYAASTNRVLQAAADRSFVTTAAGQIPITEELILTVRSGLDAAFSRATRLIAPEYEEKPVERLYPMLGVKMYLPDPLSLKSEVMSLPGGGVSIKQWQGQYQYDETGIIMVSSFDLPPETALKPEAINRILQRAIEGFSKAIGVTLTSLRVNDWRGNLSYVSSAPFKTGAVHLAFSVRALHVSGTRRIIILGCLEADMPTAMAQREQLEYLIQLID